jgi:hypothetical protein
MSGRRRARHLSEPRGLTRLEAAPGEYIRSCDPTRTVVDLMRLRHRVGQLTALAVLQRYLRRRDSRSAELLERAAALRVHRPLLHALDVASAGWSGPCAHRSPGAHTSIYRTAREKNAVARRNCSRCTSSALARAPQRFGACQQNRATAGTLGYPDRQVSAAAASLRYTFQARSSQNSKVTAQSPAADGVLGSSSGRPLHERELVAQARRARLAGPPGDPSRAARLPWCADG